MIDKKNMTTFRGHISRIDANGNIQQMRAVFNISDETLLHVSKGDIIEFTEGCG